MPKSLILIKLGGSIITDKNSEKTADLNIIDQLAQEIHEARLKSPCGIILGHGGGSFGHSQAKKYRTNEGFVDENSKFGVAEVAFAMRQLNLFITESFIKFHDPVVSLSPVSFLASSNKKPASVYIESLIQLLEKDLIPMVYGDVIVDSEIGCTIFSTEKIFNILIEELTNMNYKIEFVIEVGKTEGVYDLKGNTISEISPKNFEDIKEYLSGSEGMDVTGGMVHKVEEAYDLALKRIPTLLISANQGNLEKAILGEEVLGTWIKE